MAENTTVRLGSIIKLTHAATKANLRSLSRNYPKPPSLSGQQMVVATSDITPEIYWLVKEPHGSPQQPGSALQHGSVIRLEHWPTRRNLHTHEAPAPVTPQQREVTAYWDPTQPKGIGDNNDNWRIEIAGAGNWIFDTPIRLVHANTNVALHSHPGRVHPDRTAGEQEVTGFTSRNDDDFWVAQPVFEAIPFINQDEADRMLIASSESVSAMRQLIANFQTEAASVQDLLTNTLESARDAFQTSQTNAEAIQKAKGDIESHIAHVRELVTAFVQQSADAKATFDAIRNFAISAEENNRAILAIKAEATDTQQVIKTKSEHIEGGRKHADEVSSDLDAALNEARQSATSAEAQHQASRSTYDKIAALYGESQTAIARTETDAEAVTKLRIAAESNAATTSKLAEIAAATETRIAEYETRLTELQQAASKQRQIIDELLFGATNAGLASAFDARGKSFKTPEKIWQLAFLGALGGLFVLACYEVKSSNLMTTIPNWQELARMMLHRLPFLIPLVWLAIHAARQASLAKRMEEEYAFKATLSTSFEGYRRQMAEVSKDLSPSSPLAQLCTDTLRAISTSPGSVYEKHRMDPTPATAAAEIIKPLAEALATVATKLPDKRT
ncbi:MAG: MIR domain-containing protein [Tepidisphaeraceae bacterium]